MHQHFAFELHHDGPTTLERYVLIQALSLVRAMREGHMIPDEAEAILFKPDIHARLRAEGVGLQVLDLLREGFHLDNTLQFMGRETLLQTLGRMEMTALSLLKVRPYPGRHVWIKSF